MTAGRSRVAAGRRRLDSGLAALLVSLSIVGLTCLPHLRHPQLEPDDYRYLENADRLARGEFLQAAIVENRWDSLWWVDTEARVRFFRPTVVASYWLDRQLWGADYELGLLVTNLLIWTGCVVAVWWLACFWLGRGLPALLASAAFAALFCHGEVIWYVAGRTDSLAALGFLVALALHLSGSERPRRRWLAVPLFGVAFLTKELAVVLPALLLLHDLLVERRAATPARLLGAEWRLVSVYAGVAAAVYGVKILALGGERSEPIYPYIVDPLSTAFPVHLWVQLRSYGENLLLARPTPPFLAAGQLDGFSSPVGLWVTLAVASIVVLALRRRRRFWFLCALALGSWLPISFVYVSERFLLLPSVAVAIAAGLLLESLAGRPALRTAVGLVIVAWIAHQGWWLRTKNVALMASPRSAEIVGEGLTPLESELHSDHLLLVNLPGELFEAQFVESQLRVELGRPELRVRVLTLMPMAGEAGPGPLVTVSAGDRLTVEGRRGGAAEARLPVMRHDRFPFPRVVLDRGRRYGGGELGFQVEVLAGSGPIGRRLRFRFDRPLADQQIVVWHPSPRSGLSPLERARRGSVRLVDTSPAPAPRAGPKSAGTAGR